VPCKAGDDRNEGFAGNLQKVDVLAKFECLEQIQTLLKFITHQEEMPSIGRANELSLLVVVLIEAINRVVGVDAFNGRDASLVL